MTVDNQIVQLIKDGKQNRALHELYKNYEGFRNSFRKSGGKVADAQDIFQDALVIFIEKVQSPTFELTCQVHTYLYSICKNLSLTHFRIKGKTFSMDLEEDWVEDFSETDAEQFYVEEQKFNALDKLLKETGQKCMELLSFFYLDGMKMRDIAQKLGYKSETSAKTQKYKCIEKARSMSNDLLLLTTK